MSDYHGFDMPGVVGQLAIAAVLAVIIIALAPALLDAVMRIAPAVLVLTFIVLVLRAMVKTFLG